GVGNVGYVAVAACAGACMTGGGAMAGNCCVGGCGTGGVRRGGAALLRGAGERWPATTSSTARGGCLVTSADFTSIIALGSSHRASARSALSEMSRDSLV